MTEALVYFSKAIELCENTVGLTRDVGGEHLALYYMHRSQVYEALGLVELSRRDMLKIK